MLDKGLERLAAAGGEVALAQRNRRPLVKSKENQPFSRQNVVGFYCIGKLHNLKEQLLGRINGEILLLDVLCHVAAKQQGEH